jgi:D-alanine-D-alanine ligase
MRQSVKKLRILIAYNKPESEKTDRLDLISEAAVEEEASAVFQAVSEVGHEPIMMAIKDIEDCLKDIHSLKPDLIFNLCEGYGGKAALEMDVAGLWELLGLPYTGNSPLTLGLSQDKVLVKRLLETNRIHTPAYQVFSDIPSDTYLSFPLIAKPSREDASLGITQDSVVDSIEDLRDAVNKLLQKYRQPVLVEEFIVGREFNISLMGDSHPRVLAISEIDFSKVEDGCHPITSYEAKWMKNHPMYEKTPPVCPARVDENLKDRLEDVAIQVYKLLRGRDYGRVDTRMDTGGRIYVLEFNPNPDISKDAGFSRAIEADGMAYSRFVQNIIDEALGRREHV